MNKYNKRNLIINFLQWNDRNGCYTDKNRDLDGIPRMTYEDAVKYFFSIINDDFYYKIVDNIFELTYDEVINYAKEQDIYKITIKKLHKLIGENNPSANFYKGFII
ncbi:hypothetical protein [Clostridium intestinale]|uniref:hypothetical protein n=1 Tax=Clostridium intestinale TaxID=36845 RepID=UPI002DD69ABE|nr:hypothetical protein [Clostridium intestinale]WRY50711.1 hypothetical protein P8F83_18895 [Clostridium intestinale]